MMIRAVGETLRWHLTSTFVGRIAYCLDVNQKVLLQFNIIRLKVTECSY